MTGPRFERFGDAVRQRRIALGMSQTGLSARLAISRQNLAEIEAGRRLPQLSLATRLASQLGWSVDRLVANLPRFEPAAEPKWALGSPPSTPVPVVWTHIDGAVVLIEAGRTAPNFTADGLFDPITGGVKESKGSNDPAATLVVAGCDPFLPWLWERTPHPDLALYVLPMGSQPAIDALRARTVHIAGTHLFDEITGSYNRHLDRLGFRVVRWQYMQWESGLMGALRSPEGWVLRETGSEARAAFDRRYDGVSGSDGLIVELDSHWAIARYVKAHPGLAGVGIRPVADALGVPFSLWTREPYEWVTRAEWAEDPRIRGFEHWLRSPDVARVLEQLPGLNPSQPGMVVG